MAQRRNKMARRRDKENPGPAARRRFYHGAYPYQVSPGQEAAPDGKRQFKLGKTRGEAYGAWAERVELRENFTTVGELLDSYALKVVAIAGRPCSQNASPHSLSKRSQSITAASLTSS
jgi:hypothetical protein